MSQPSALDLLRFGRPGEPIAGSKFYRAWCPVCGQPFRHADQPAAAAGLLECEDCRGLLPLKVLRQQRALRTDPGPALAPQAAPRRRSHR